MSAIVLDRQNTAEFGEALEFIEKVKLHCDPDMYGQFIEIIKWGYITRTTTPDNLVSFDLVCSSSFETGASLTKL